MKLVVCDDDATLRSVISRLAESAGHTVIAETDSAGDAVELVARFGAEALVLDLSLPFGSGMEAVRELRRRGVPCDVVVFSAYVEEQPQVLDLGVRAVVEKPDFDALEEVFAQLAGRSAPPDGVAVERRRDPRARPSVPTPIIRSPSGLEEPDSFDQAVAALEPGDAVLYVHVGHPEARPDPWTELLETDRFLAVARTMRSVLRVQDRLTADAGFLAALLLDSQRLGVQSAWSRLERAHELTVVGGVLTGGWALCDEDDPPFAIRARALEAARRSIGQPPGDRLWAG